MSAYEFYINGVSVGQPKEFDGFEQEVVRDYKKRFLRVAYPGSFTLTNASGYQQMRALFLADVCGIVDFEAYELCGSTRYLLVKGGIVLSDCKWNLEKCTVEVDVQDEAIGERLDNNVRIPVSPQSPLSKNAVSIDPCAPLDIEVFDPADPVGDYLTPTRGMFDWLDAIRHCIQYMTDARIDVVSEWYEALPDSQRISIVSGYQLRTGDTADDALRLTYDFNALWLEVANRYNLWIAVRRDNTGRSYLAIEPEGDMFNATQAFTLLHQYELVQSVDTERLYSAVRVGDEDGIQNLEATYALPYIVLQGFSAELFHFAGVCNIDEVLDLTGKWYADTNMIEHVLVTDPTSDEYDKDTFLIQYDRYTMRAVKGDYLQPGSNPYLYNEQMLNINILNRYPLPSDVGAFYNSEDAQFLASGSGPVNGASLVQPVSVDTTAEYPLTGVSAPLANDDSTPPNNNVSGSFNTTTQRYTAPVQGYYEFQRTLNWSWSYFVENGVVGVSMNAVFRRFDASDVLIASTTVTGTGGPLAGQVYSFTATAGFVLNATDYVTVEFVRVVTRVVPALFSTSSVIVTPLGNTFRTTFVAAGGGRITSVDPLSARVITYEFDRLIPISQWQALVNDPRLGVGVSHTGGDVKACHVLKAQRDSVKGKTTFTLIATRRNV